MNEVLKDWVDHHARQRPDSIALADAHTDVRVTWRELEYRVGRLARALLDRGVQARDRVVLMVENDVRIFDVQFACMRIGAIMMPLNWRLALPELHQMMADATPVLMIHDETWSEPARELATAQDVKQLIGWGPRSAPTDDAHSSYETLIASIEHPVRGGDLDPDAVTQLLYTSGTTGLPKGVLCTNRTLVAQAQNTAHSSRMSQEGGHHLNIVPLFHAGGLNVFTNPMLFWGGRVTTVGRFDAADTLRLLTDPDLGVTHLCGVLQMYEWVTALEEFPTAVFPTLRTVLFGGWGPSAQGIYRAWAERGIWVQLSYGASEIGPNVSILSWADPEAAERGTSGPILPHTRVRFVDTDGVDVAPGEAGEILVCGPGVIPGYWNQPREGIFLGDWFRTGDVGRLDIETNQLYIIGRVKEMYRSGGENVYPAEVEAVLAEMPGVAECAVLGVPDERWGETGLVAVICQPGGVVTLEDVHAFASGKLARFKLPSHLMLVDDLPRSATDKISRPAIRAEWEQRRAK